MRFILYTLDPGTIGELEAVAELGNKELFELFGVSAKVVRLALGKARERLPIPFSWAVILRNGLDARELRRRIEREAAEHSRRVQRARSQAELSRAQLALHERNGCPGCAVCNYLRTELAAL